MRKELENKRPAYAFDIKDTNGTLYRLAVSFEKEEIKEVWINGGGKVGTERHDILTEIGRIISVALQNSVPFEELKSCATYHSSGAPSTIIGLGFNELDFKSPE